MTPQAQTVEAIVGSALGVIALGGFALRVILKPLRRVADAYEVVAGSPPRIVNGYEVEPHRPGVAERFDQVDEQIGRLDEGQKHLVAKVDKIEWAIGQGLNIKAP